MKAILLFYLTNRFVVSSCQRAAGRCCSCSMVCPTYSTVNNSIIPARSFLLLLSCPYESTVFSFHSLAITSWYSYLSPRIGVLLPGGGGRICLVLMNPCGLPKIPTLNLLKCLWQALKRLLSLTKTGSIKMSDETQHLSTFALILVEHQHCVIAATPTSRRSYQPITRFLITQVLRTSGDLIENAEIRGFVGKRGQTVQHKHLICFLRLAGVRHKGNFLLF